MAQQFAVIGLGRFGSSVARSLTGMGHQVLAIDSDEERVQKVSEFVTHAVTADATDPNALRALGIRNFDTVVVGIGTNMQASILCTLLLKELGVKYVVARADDELHGKVLQRTGADKVIFPERDIGIRVAHNLNASTILDYIELTPDYSILEIATRGPLVGQTLRQLDLRTRFNVNVIAIRSGKTMNITPKADDVANEGDMLVVVGRNDDIKRLEDYQ
ncbi:MAG TPA: TrkA family potassium uptake protein [Bacillota bacterium]